MARRFVGRSAIVALGLLATGCASPRDQAANDPFAWPAVTRTARPWAYWWWLGSAVDPANLSRELARYREAGYGGLNIFPIYGARGYETRYVPYLSPAWLGMLRHAVTEAARLDMGVDMTTGTGWCFGGPNVPESHAGMKLDASAIDVPPSGKIKTLLDRTSLMALVAVAEDGRRRDLLPDVGPEGAVDAGLGEGSWKVFACSARPTRLRVKRAAPGGEGWMLNPFHRDAIRDYLVRFSEAFSAYDGPRPRAMSHDSYEYYGCDVSPDFFEQFERRRGYRLQDELPAFLGRGTDDRAARVKCDFRETASDLLVERFLPTWAKWSRGQGFLTRCQAHGSPGNLLDLYATADIPETEMFGREREVLVSKFASSAAHVAGRGLVSAETGTWLSEHFTETLGDMKRLVDQLFVSGANHVFYHSTCYSPDDAGWPGWLFYASTQMNPRNSIWRDVPALNAYVARCQSILQSGRADNDLLLYWPIHDLWHKADGMLDPIGVHNRDWFDGQSVGRAARRLWRRGYSFDYVSDRQLAGAKPKGRDIEVAGGQYGAIVVPTCERIPLETLRTLLALAEEGGTVVFQDRPPRDVPGLGRLEERRSALRDRLRRAPIEDGAPGKLACAEVGRGRILVGDLEAALDRAGVVREPLADPPGILFVRRACDVGRHYFVVNHGDQALDRWAPLSADAESAALMDPASGRVGAAALRKDAEGRTQVYLQIEPGESIVIRTFAHRKIAGPGWPYLKRVGDAVEIQGPWQVSFIEGGPERPSSFRTRMLGSWTALGGEEARRFAGTALYAATFDAPTQGGAFRLDLGKVCQSARVRLNGRDLGTLFAPPFRVRVEELRPKGNALEVEVTNVSANRIRDLDRRGVTWRIFNDINFVDQDYKPFDASRWPLHDSGLMGPVTLEAVSPLDPR